MSHIWIFAIIAIFSHNVEYQAAVTASFGFSFEKKMHVELPRRWKQLALLFDEVEKLSQVNLHDVGMHAVL